MATTSVESLQNKDTGKTWKEDFSNVTKGTQAYDDLLVKFTKYASARKGFDDKSEERLKEYLKNLDDVSKHWTDINSEIEDILGNMDVLTASAMDVQAVFDGIARSTQTVGQQLAAQRSIVSKLADLAGGISRAYSIEGQFSERNLKAKAQEVKIYKDKWDFQVRMLTGGSLEAGDLDKARKLHQSIVDSQSKRLKNSLGLSNSEKRAIQDKIALENHFLELLSKENRQYADRLKDLAEYNVRNRKEVTGDHKTFQRFTGLAGKLANTLGMQDLASDIKDQYENTIQDLASKRFNVKQFKDSGKSLVGKASSERQLVQDVIDQNPGGQDQLDLLQYDSFSKVLADLRKAKEEKPEQSDQIDKSIAAVRAKQESLVQSNSLLKDYDDAQQAVLDNENKLKVAQEAVSQESKTTLGVAKDIAKSFKATAGSVWMLAFVVGKALWGQFKAVDELGVKLQREIGTWEGGVAGANNELISSKDYLEQAYEISTKFHIDPARVFTPTELAKAAEFKNMSNLSAQEVANLAVRSKSVNQSVNAYNTSMKEGYNNILKNTTTAVAFGSVQKEIANTTDAISLSLGDNPKKIAEAATAALSLGMSMKEIEGVAENLMNFESSIEHEMEAQLLTGRQMNLAKARECALNNDIAGLSRELKNNGVDAAKFQNMTYIQQKSLAQALGMSRDQLAGMVRQQILGMNISDEAKRKMLKMNEEDYRRMTTEEQWQKTKEKFLQTLVPIMKIVLDTVTLLVGPLKWIAGFLGKVIGFVQPIIDAVQSFFSKMQKWSADGETGIKKVVGTVVTGGANMASSLLMFSLVLGTAKKSLGGIGIAFKVVKTVITTGFGTITSIFKGALGGIKSIVTAIKGIGTASKSAAVANKALGTSLSSIGDRKLERTLARDLKNTRRRTKLSNPDLVARYKSIYGKRPKGAPAPQIQKPDLTQTVTRSSRKHKPAVWDRYYRIKANRASGKVRNFTENTFSRAGKITDKASKSVVGGIESTAANLDTKASKKISKINRGVTKFSSGGILKGAAAMVLVAGALYILAKAVQQFDGVKWKTLGKAGAGLGGLVAAAVILSNLASKALVGALAIAAMGVALIPLAYSLKLLEGVNWKTFAIMAASIAAFFVEFALIGSVIAGTAGIGGVVIAAGVAAVAAMGAALIPLAIAMQKLEGVSWKTFGMMCASIAAFCVEVALLGPLALAGLPGVLLLSFALKLLSSTIAKLGSSFKGSDITAIGEGIASLRSTLEGLKGLDIDLSSVRKFKRGVKQISKALRSFGKVGNIKLPEASNLVAFFKGLETIDLSKVKIPNKVIAKLFGIFAALSVVSGKNIVSGIDTLTASLVKFVEVLGKIDTEKFNSLSGKKIRQIAVAGIVSERVSENYNKSVDNKAKVDATKLQQANEVRVEKTNLDTVLAKMEDIRRTIVASRPDWKWLEFGNEAAKNIPNWQSPV